MIANETEARPHLSLDRQPTFPIALSLVSPDRWVELFDFAFNEFAPSLARVVHVSAEADTTSESERFAMYELLSHPNRKRSA